ncbi:MAG: hypothetical protein LBQ70_04835, partial [Prevotellaceae bacterium]|nr:hypothetical protein [Prevotellaceae bacterium]
MLDIDNMNDLPALAPDESIRFDSKDEIKRSSEMEFECSELEYRCLIAAEEHYPLRDIAENRTAEKLVNLYGQIRLIPDTDIVMPDKNSLKHRTFKTHLPWISIAAAAAIIAFVLIMVKDKPVDLPVVAETDSERVLNPVPKTESEIKPEPKIEIHPDKTAENKMDTPAGKTVETVKTTDKPVARTIENRTDEEDISAEIPESSSATPGRESIRIEPVITAFAPVEMMNREKTVFAYERKYRQTPVLKVINNMTSVAEKLAADAGSTKQTITQILDGFRLPNILSRLSLDSGIDGEIDKWAKNNPDIPFDVFIDYSGENRMTEIYDENGTLVRAIFFTD